MRDVICWLLGIHLRWRFLRCKTYKQAWRFCTANVNQHSRFFARDCFKSRATPANKKRPSDENCSLFGCWVFTCGEDSCVAKLTSKLDASAPRMWTNTLAQREIASKVELHPRQTKNDPRMRAVFCLAGVAGFEPTNKGVKVLCLTAWRYPYVKIYTSSIIS